MVEHEKEVIEDGKRVKIKEMKYEYEAEMEESYRQSLIKSFKKTITDGYFPFVVVDNVNQKVRNFGEMWSFAKQNGFQVKLSNFKAPITRKQKIRLRSTFASWTWIRIFAVDRIFTRELNRILKIA